MEKFDDRPDFAKRLEEARIERGFSTAKEAATYFGWSYDTYAQHENGTRGINRASAKYAKAFRVSEGWLLTGQGSKKDAQPKITTIVGKAGAATDGRVVFAEGHGGLGSVIVPEGATEESVAIEVEGYSMGFLADGALVFYSERHSTPTEDMLGMIVVVETADGDVLLKRLLRGSKPGLYDLESINGPTLHDKKIVWAAHIDSLVPPWRAKRLRVESMDVAV